MTAALVPVREPIFAAMFQLVAGDPRAQAFFVTMQRLLVPFEKVTAAQLPALFMFQRPERRVQKGQGIPSIRTLVCDFHVYVTTAPGAATLPATMLNNAMDIIDQVITEPLNPGNTQTLGGLVQHVYASPMVDNYEGLLQEKSILVAQVEMLIP